MKNEISDLSGFIIIAFLSMLIFAISNAAQTPAPSGTPDVTLKREYFWDKIREETQRGNTSIDFILWKCKELPIYEELKKKKFKFKEDEFACEVSW